MNNEAYNKRILKAAKLHKELLDKELAYSDDLQNKEAINRHRANYEKVIGMLK